MSNISVKTELSLNEFFKGIEQLSVNELDNIISKLVSLKTRKLGPQLQKAEADLIKTIFAKLKVSEQKKYDHLSQKLLDKTLSKKEHEELTKLIEKVEEIELRKAQAMLTLTQIRGISIEELMSELDMELN